MAKIFLFMMVSLDGYFEGENHDISWHNVDAEFNEYAIEQTKSVGTFLYGHRTYDLMSGYWPTEEPRANDPVVAELMNKTPKVVFSKKLDKLESIKHWENVTLKNEIIKSEIEKLKQESEKDIAIYGSNQLCVEMMKLGLVDEFRIMVNPVAIGKGTSLFKGLEEKFKLELKSTKQFKSGNTLLCYSKNTPSCDGVFLLNGLN